MILGPNSNEIIEEWIKLHSEELNNLYSSPNITWVIKSRRMRLSRNVTHIERGAYRVVMGKTEFKRPLGRARHRWEDMKMYLQEVGCGGMDYIDLAHNQDRWWARKHGNEPSGAIKCMHF
jgi:hypothetical protein